MSLEFVTKDMKDPINVQVMDPVESLAGDHNGVAGIRDDLIIADGEKDVCSFFFCCLLSPCRINHLY